MKWFGLHSPADDGAGGGGGVSTGGNRNSSGPGEGREARQAPDTDNIYGNGPASGEAEGADGAAAAGEGDPKEGAQGAEGEEGNENFGDDKNDEVVEGVEGAEGAEGAEGDDPEGETPPAAAPVLQLSPETIAALRGERQETGPKVPTKEEVAKLLNPVVVTDDMVAAIRSDDPAVVKQALQSLMMATVKNAYSIAKVMIQRKEQEFDERLGPITEQHQKAQLAQTRNEFYSTNGHLKKYDTIVKAAAREIDPNHADGSPKTQKQIFTEVATKTLVTLKSLGIVVAKPNANPGAAGAPIVKRSGNVPGPNRLSPAGRSGGGQAATKTNDNNPDADIYRR